MSDMPDSINKEWKTNHREKLKAIKDIHCEMYVYISSEILQCVCDRFFSLDYVDYYLDEEELEKCRYFLDTNNINSHLLRPITDVALEIFRKNHPCAGQSMIPTGEERYYFSKIFIDTDFLDKIDENYWYLCRQTYEYVRSMIICNHRVIKYMGKSIMSYILDCELSDTPDYQMHKACKLAYKAAYELQRENMNVRWSFLYGQQND